MTKIYQLSPDRSGAYYTPLQGEKEGKINRTATVVEIVSTTANVHKQDNKEKKI